MVAMGYVHMWMFRVVSVLLSHFDVCSMSSGLLDGPEEKGNAKLQDLEYVLQCISNKTTLQSL